MAHRTLKKLFSDGLTDVDNYLAQSVFLGQFKGGAQAIQPVSQRL